MNDENLRQSLLVMQVYDEIIKGERIKKKCLKLPLFYFPPTPIHVLFFLTIPRNTVT